MNQELDEKTKFNIKIRLYPLVKLILEDGYRDIWINTKLIFKNKKDTIEQIYSQIDEFAMHNVESVDLVQEYLLNLIDISKEEKTSYNKEYSELQRVIASNNMYNVRKWRI